MSRSTPLWMVRAGRGSRYIDEFLEQGYVGIGPYDLEGSPITSETDKATLLAYLIATEPDDGEATLATWASQLLRYHRELEVGHEVTSYDPGRRLYYLGTIRSDVHDSSNELNLARDVEWRRKVHRDALSVSTRNSLGAIQTLFRLPDPAADEMRRLSVGLDETAVISPPKRVETEAEGLADARTGSGPAAEALRGVSETEELDEKTQLDEVVSKAKEFIEDRISRLKWDEMQELVAGILEAMGYRATVSDTGPDRGVDIFASRDGLGLEEPRIFVEVKHRPGTSIGAPDLRAFLGGRRPGDRCLYVSTGGFTKDARYEADRASVPLTLLTLPDLRELLVEHYENLDPSIAGLVRLERIYWPVG